MNHLVPLVQHVSGPMLLAAHALAPAIAETANRPVLQGDYVAAAFAVSAGLIGFACVYWACWAHVRFSNFRIAVQQERGRAAAQAYFQERLLNQGAQAVAILRNTTQEPQYFGDADALLQACRSGPDGPAVSEAIFELAESGMDFTLCARTTDNRAIELRGVPVGHRAVVYLQDKGSVDATRNYREVLDALPVPVWVREGSMMLGWANRAFLSVTGAASLESALAANVALDWSERDLSSAVLDERRPIEARRSATVGGQRRTFKFNLMPLEGATVAGIAADITDYVHNEASLTLVRDAQADVMEQLPFGVAVFDTNQRLINYNGICARLWGLQEDWLDTSPTHDEILDRLRDGRKLPEQRNFAEWKQLQLQLFADPMGVSEEQWHLPGGRSLRVEIRPHLQGGKFIILEDISDRLHLESSMALLTQVQRATLDTIDEGIAIFGPDGRLALHNALFATMWRFAEDELVAHPHFAEIAEICTQRIGQDGIWGIVSCGVNTNTPERLGQWGKVRRADGRVISLAMSRLPNGATVVTFTDLTDLERFGGLQNEDTLQPGLARVS